MQPRLRLALAAGLCVIAAVTGYVYLARRDATVRLLPAADCALHLETCSAVLPRGGRVRLDIEPKSPSPTDPLRVKADFEGIRPESVGLRLKGVDMEMGYLEYFVHELGRISSDESGASFGGSAGVFACSMSLMRWQVLLRIDLDGTAYEIPFDFETRQKT